MASINRSKRELVFKIVFYGPGLGGKTTTLRHIHAATRAENRGNMVSLATDTDRTLYFDYLPIKLLKFGSMGVKLQLYTVPGQVYYAATRKLVLSGADGIVFVADTQSARFDSDHESLDDLNANLAEQGRKLSSVPHVFQWNKRDLPSLVPIEELDRRLNLFAAPAIPTVATTGDGVFETLERITRQVMDAYRTDLTGPSKLEGLPLFLDAEELGLADAIKGLADSQRARPGSGAEAATAGAPSGRGPRDVVPGVASGAGAQHAPAAAARHRSSTFSSAPTPAPPLAPGGLPTPAGPISDPLAPDPGVFSLAQLWPAGDRDRVRRVESALAQDDLRSAVVASEELIAGVLAAAAAMAGERTSPDAITSAALLGLDAARYLRFRSVVRGMRSNHTPTPRDALDCYLLALDARRALDRVSVGNT